MTTIDYSAEIAGEATIAITDKPAHATIFGTIRARFVHWRQRNAERRMLLELSNWDPRLLNDIGVTASDVRAALNNRHHGLQRRD